MPEQGFTRLNSLYLYGSGGFWSNVVEKTVIFFQFSIFTLFCGKRAADALENIDVELSMIINKLLASKYLTLYEFIKKLISCYLDSV